MMRPRKPDIEAVQRQRLRQSEEKANDEEECFDPNVANCSTSLDPTCQRQASPCGECIDNDADAEEPNRSSNFQQQFTYKSPSTSCTVPPEHVPNPQIQSDSKKTSSPRRYRYNTSLHRRIFEVTLIFHLFSLFACVASNHYARSSSSSSSPSSSTHHSQSPCKKLQFLQQQNQSVSIKQCKAFATSDIQEICSAGTPSRIRMLHELFLFTDLQPLSLFELFSVGWKEGGKWQLQSGEKGNDCISGSINRCTSCFKRFSATLTRLRAAYESFDTTLSRFDCLPAVDTASATRPFSPNATCDNCKIWYRRWLLVQTLQIWQRVPCINWCYYTQLACPHLAPAKLWDYAGHPSFQCRDMDIDSWRQECDCIHPCDVRGVVIPGVIGNAPSFRHDFFAAQVHCETRKRECRARSTAHDRMSSSDSIPIKPALSSSSHHRTSGFLVVTTAEPRSFFSILFLLLWML